MKALITGSSGFVGGFLRQHLQSLDYEVFGTDVVGGEGSQRVDLLDKDAVSQLIQDVKPDQVYHLAAQSSVKLSFDKPQLTHDINVKGTTHLLEAIATHTPDARVLIVSSAEVYGIPQTKILTEDSPTNPTNPYAESKLAQEKVALNSACDCVIVRSFPHIGPGQKPLFVSSSFAKQIAEIETGSRDVLKVGNLEAKRDFLDVRDVVIAYELALRKCEKGSLFNICKGESVSIDWLLNTFIEMSEKEIRVEVDEKLLRPSDIPHLGGNPEPFQNATGWEPTIPLSDTLMSILEFWRESLRKGL